LRSTFPRSERRYIEKPRNVHGGPLNRNTPCKRLRLFFCSTTVFGSFPGFSSRKRRGWWSQPERPRRCVSGDPESTTSAGKWVGGCCTSDKITAHTHSFLWLYITACLDVSVIELGSPGVPRNLLLQTIAGRKRSHARAGWSASCPCIPPGRRKTRLRCRRK